MTDGDRVRGGGGGGEERGGTAPFPAETCRRRLVCREPPKLLLLLSAEKMDPAGLASGRRRGDPGVEVRRRSPPAFDEGDVPIGRAAALDLLAE